MKKVIVWFLVGLMLCGPLFGCERNEIAHKNEIRDSETESQNETRDSDAGNKNDTLELEEYGTQKSEYENNPQESDRNNAENEKVIPADQWWLEPDNSDIEIFEMSIVDEYAYRIRFRYQGVAYYGILNHKGEILYVGDTTHWVSIAEDAGVIDQSIICTDGSIIQAGEDSGFDRIVGYGNGYVLVNQDDQWDKVTSYGVIDKHGKWVCSMQESRQLSISHFKYYGEGFFAEVSQDGNFDVYNYKSNTSFTLFNVQIAEDQKEDGLLYCAPDFPGHTPMRCDDIDNSAILPLPQYFTLDKQGRVSEISEDIYKANAGIQSNREEEISIRTETEYIHIVDSGKGTDVAFTEYRADQLYWAKVYGSYICAYIIGENGTCFFTVLDTMGNMFFEPLQCGGIENQPKIFENRIVYELPDGRYSIIHLKGDIILPADNGCEHISDYENGVAVAYKYKDDGLRLNRIYYLLDKNGNKMDITLKASIKADE